MIPKKLSNFSDKIMRPTNTRPPRGRDCDRCSVKLQGGRHAALAEIADHHRRHAGGELHFRFLWHWLFRSEIPSYLSGAIGGLTALPTWEFVRRIRPRH